MNAELTFKLADEEQVKELLTLAPLPQRKT
jgi:hypothetical protein